MAIKAPYSTSGDFSEVYPGYNKAKEFVENFFTNEAPYDEEAGMHYYVGKDGKKVYQHGGADPMLSMVDKRRSFAFLIKGLKKIGLTMNQLNILVKTLGPAGTWEFLKSARFTHKWFKKNPYTSKTDPTKISHRIRKDSDEISGEWSSPGPFDMISRTDIVPISSAGKSGTVAAHRTSNPQRLPKGRQSVEINENAIDLLGILNKEVAGVPLSSLGVHETAHMAQKRSEFGMSASQDAVGGENYPFPQFWMQNKAKVSRDAMSDYFWGDVGPSQINAELMMDEAMSGKWGGTMIGKYVNKGLSPKDIGWQRDPWRDELYDMLRGDIKYVDKNFIKANPNVWGTKTSLAPQSFFDGLAIPGGKDALGQKYLLDLDDTFFPMELNTRFGNEMHSRMMEMREMLGITDKAADVNLIRVKVNELYSATNKVSQRDRLDYIVDEFAGILQGFDGYHATATGIDRARWMSNKFPVLFKKLNKMLPAAVPLLFQQEELEAQPRQQMSLPQYNKGTDKSNAFDRKNAKEGIELYNTQQDATYNDVEDLMMKYWQEEGMY